ncbi:MAG TPA: DegV family protein [Acidimicrobiales bacterium]|jgi:DegV family protein with EDD domain|nr:DegV family protein [Acidimicrobiales bacterium]MDP6213965.1 DegV family protein [Acidimicrobiales bacterium]MDP7209589.1 DegV family protein [Acidimicrobiales bacterium]HJL90223.1 DegV family protein [Acidimicrobiales bacterium]HJO98253.1 DegV family protein [Acidimicrobiales bacterium]|tara:strand:- start:11302 stop:12138 length:837 start_codon:yes stop_codon:yes gene_type:complete
MTVRIVTDSACDLSNDEVSSLGIDVVPLSIRFGEQQFLDRDELSVEDFYSRMAASDDLPQTAAPAPGAFEAVFRRRLDEGADSIVCINLSAGLSATLQSAETGARDLNADIRLIDSRSITGGLGTMVLAAARAANTGASADEIVALVEDLSARTRVYGAIDTLENLKKGGRIGNAQALLGSVLSIKPLIDISTGVVEEAGRQRTRRKSLGWLRDKVAEHGSALSNLSVMHAQADDINVLLEMLAPLVDPAGTRVGVIGPVVASHGGPGVIGMCFTLES